MPDADPYTYLIAATLLLAGLLVTILGLRMFRDGKGPDAAPQTAAGVALIVAAAALPFATPSVDVGSISDLLARLTDQGVGAVLFVVAFVAFAAANAALSLRLVLLERRRDGVLFLVAGLAASLLAIALLVQTLGSTPL